MHAKHHPAHHGWHEEKRSAWLYRQVAAAEAGNHRHHLFHELAEAAEHQAEIWANELRKAGQPTPTGFVPDTRTRLVGWLTGKLGVRRMRHILAAMKVRGMSLYHAAHPHTQPTHIDQVGKRHVAPGTNNLRAAVFGINDGLISNASLILGIAGATSDNATVLLAGTAGLLAGAFSMAAGEYVSVRAQREYYEYQISLEREELDQYPQEEAAELALIYAAKGIPKDTATQLAKNLIRDPEQALDTLAREELGLNPGELGSPWGAAIASFLAFAVGAGLPLLPYASLANNHALGATILVTTVSLFVVGAVISLFTGKQALYGGARMLLIGSAAGAATWWTGRALGVALG